MDPLLLGIDIGTSACKIALFKPDGAVVCQTNESYDTYYPDSGWAEQNPEEWWQAVCRGIKHLIGNHSINPSNIAGIGIDGQSWCSIPIDKNGICLYNTPLWMDTRAKSICDELESNIGSDEIFNTCGNPLQPTYTLPKILWLKKYRPEIYSKTYKILQSNSYIAFKLTDVVTQDISQGYGLQCFNMRKGEWDYKLCKEMGVEPSLLPQIVSSSQIIGTVSKKAAQESGLCEGIPVAAGGLDAACGTLGAGVIHSGETQEQGGQAGGMSICLSQYKADPSLILSYHVVPDKWLLQGGTVGGGGVMRWLEEEIGCAERIAAQKNGTNSFYEMDVAAEKVPCGSEGVLFLPYMSGERSPIWDPSAKGVFYGLDYSKTRAHMIRAGMEGVAYSLMHNLEIAEKIGAVVNELRAMGGAANSRLWTQIKADVTGKKITVPSSDTATTLGAVMLAGVGVGIYKNFDEAVSATVKTQRVHVPNMSYHEEYKKGFEKYKKLYLSLKSLMKEGM